MQHALGRRRDGHTATGTRAQYAKSRTMDSLASAAGGAADMTGSKNGLDMPTSIVIENIGGTTLFSINSNAYHLFILVQRTVLMRQTAASTCSCTHWTLSTPYYRRAAMTMWAMSATTTPLLMVSHSS